MNLLASFNLPDQFEYIFADWAIALFIFFAVLILLAILFKGLKVGIILFVIVAVFAGLGVLAAFVFMILTWDLLRIIDFAIRWGPTALFVTIILIATLINAKRGLRKSLILLAQAVVAAIICIIFFYTCVKSVRADKTILSIINLILGHNGLQKALGVSQECETLREIFAEWLPTLLGGDMGILLSANPQYIVTLADMAFRIVFTVVTFIVYLLLVFFLYVIYFFAYPERRHKKKIKRAVALNMSDRTYKKHHLGGGIVGLVRGITAGLLSLSFIGSAFFMVSGGLGPGTLGAYDFDNDNYNFYYSIYRSIDSYGSQGIFKVLNTMRDANDTPFYLFAADMVLSGELDDEENGIKDKNIKFREELAAYTGFAKETLKLLLKYGKEDIVDILNGRNDGNSFDTIVNIMTIPEFRDEFDLLIAEFDSKTYIINFGMSLVTTIVEHIDEISFTSSIGEDNKELLKILFKKGHLSDKIPDELKIKQDIEAGIIAPDGYKARPRLKVSHLLNKDDIRIALEVAFSILSGEQDTKDTLALVKSLLPEVKQLSILNTSRSGELDPVLSRLYCYCQNRYLTDEGSEGITYAEISDKKINWLSELNMLIDVAGDAINFWNNIYDDKSTALDMLLWAFDAQNPDYADNERYFDNICNALESSQIIGVAMSTSYMYNEMKRALADISPNIYLPEKINYSNITNADGSITYGELHQFFCGFRILITPEYSDFLKQVVDIAGGSEVNISELLDSLSTALEYKDKYGNTLSFYLTESELLRSAISISLIENGQNTIYIPKASLEKLSDGTTVNVINKLELRQLYDDMPAFIELIRPVLDSNPEDEDYISKVAGIIKSEDFTRLIERNRIVEGTIANVLVKYVADNEYVVVPARLVEDIDGWVTADGKKGELRNLLDALGVIELDFEKIANGEFNPEDLFDMILAIDEEGVDTLLSSQILHYTLSKYVIEGVEAGGFKIIVPNSARTLTENDVIPYLVKKDEIKNLFDIVTLFDLSDEELDISSVLYKLVINKDKLEKSIIMSATLVYTVANNEDIQASITLPPAYLSAGSEEALSDYNSSNIWKAELPRFINALDEILGISISDEFVFDGDSIASSLSDFLMNLNEPARVNDAVTKLELCYNSDIIWGELSVRLDEALLESGIVPEDILREIKVDGYYKLEEVQALARALEVFGIEDLLTANGEDIIAQVTAKALSLNDYNEKYGVTSLEAIYPSKIISYIFSDQLDGVLKDGELIEENILNRIKNGSRIYDIADVAAFIDAVKELGITDLDGMTDFDFTSIGNLNADSESHPETTRLGVIYNSRIAAGVITKSLYDILNSGEISDRPIDHSKAYQDGIKIYRFEEVESMFEVFADLKDMDLGNINLEKVSGLLYDETAEVKTRSYLLAAAISAIIRDNENFIIPVSVVDEEGCINPSESSLIISVFCDLFEGENLEDMENWEINQIPEGETREKLLNSAILRAGISYNIGLESYNIGKSIYMSTDPAYAERQRDMTGEYIVIITKEELKNLIAALELIGETSSDAVFSVPDFTIEEIVGYEESTLDVLLKSNIIYYKICECILNLRSNGLIEAYFEDKTIEQRSYNLYTELEETVEVISEETIAEFISYYKSYLH